MRTEHAYIEYVIYTRTIRPSTQSILRACVISRYENRN